MSVSKGVVAREDPAEKKKRDRQEHKLREKMIKKKHRNLYRSMMKGRAERAKEAWLLGKKRRLYDEQEKVRQKAERKEKRLKAAADT
jgi:pescadillo protein